MAQPQSPLDALVSPTVSPDADQAGPRPKQQRGRSRQHQHRHQHHQQQQQQQQRPRWGSANRTARGGAAVAAAAAARSAAKKKSGGGGSSSIRSNRNHKRTNSGSSTRSTASARRLWSEGDDDDDDDDDDARGGSTTDTAGTRRHNKDVHPTTPSVAEEEEEEEGVSVEKITPAASGGDGVRRCWTRRRSRSGGRSSWSRERAPEPQVLAATAADLSRGEMSARVDATSDTASPGRRRQGQEGEDAAAAEAAVGDIRKAAEGRGATATTPRGDGDGDGRECQEDKEARESLRAALDRVEGLERGWAERAKAYEVRELRQRGCGRRGSFRGFASGPAFFEPACLIRGMEWGDGDGLVPSLKPVFAALAATLLCILMSSSVVSVPSLAIFCGLQSEFPSLSAPSPPPPAHLDTALLVAYPFLTSEIAAPEGSPNRVPHAAAQPPPGQDRRSRPAAAATAARRRGCCSEWQGRRRQTGGRRHWFSLRFCHPNKEKGKGRGTEQYRRRWHPKKALAA